MALTKHSFAAYALTRPMLMGCERAQEGISRFGITIRGLTLLTPKAAEGPFCSVAGQIQSNVRTFIGLGLP